MNRFGIITTALPARGSRRAARKNYVPRKTWRLFHLAGRKYKLQVLFFRAEDIDFVRKRVHAWNCSSEDGMSGWTRNYQPLPDVVYENCFLNLIGSDPRILHVKNQCIRRGIPTFNPIFFNKLALHRILSKHPKTSPFIPPSKYVQTISDVMNYLKIHKQIYLKPVNGSGGAGILQIEWLSNNRIRVKAERFKKDQKFFREFSTEDFKNFIAIQLAQRKYLAQKGLKLIQKGNQKIDFRVVVHRDSYGKWKCAGIRPKLGKPGSMVTNSHAGGTKTTWSNFFAWAKEVGKPIPDHSEIEKAAITVAEHLTRFRPTLSHLGIDVAVCDDQKIYVLDVNPRPGRDLLTPEMLIRVTDLTAGFASYLARTRGTRN